MRENVPAGADEVRWPPRSSKPLFCRKAMGGFDSLAFPPASLSKAKLKPTRTRTVMTNPLVLVRALLFLCLAWMLAGCGGSESSAQIPVQPNPQAPNWSWLAGTRWAIPLEHQRAYLLPAGASEPLAVKEQVVLTIESYNDGYIVGRARIEVSSPAIGDLGSLPLEALLVGSITPEGRLNLSFTTAGGTQTTAVGSLLTRDGQMRMQLQCATGANARLVHQAELRQLAEGETPPLLAEGEQANPSADSWSWLPGTTWYVPQDYLLAYLVGPPGTDPVPINDQTIYTVTDYDKGYFWGPTTVSTSMETGVGTLDTPPTNLTMLGCVTPDGQILLSFSSADDSTPPTTGFGTMQLLEGEWTMENQTASGEGVSLIHWAYMKQLRAGQTPPPVDGPILDSALTSPEWASLQGTSWYVPEAYLPALLSGLPGQPVVEIQDQTRYSIGSYANGYFFGQASIQLTLPDGSSSTQSATLSGTVTPEGALYLLFRPAGSQGSSTVGLGRMSSLNGQVSMENQMSSGDSVRITHWAYMLQE